MIWFIFAVFCLIGWALSLFTHELSHVIANKIIGRTIITFKPWPHTYRRRFFFGRVSSIGPREHLIWVNISPVIKNIIFGSFWVTLALCLYTPLFAFAITELGDLSWWFKGFIFGPEATDGAKFKSRL